MNIRNFIEGNRQTGSTTALVRAVMETNGWLVVGDLNFRSAICKNHPYLNKENVITVNQIKNGIMRGQTARAVFFDATALLHLVNEQNEEIPPLTVVKVGDKNNQPTVQDLETWRSIFEAALIDKDFMMASHSPIEITQFPVGKAEHKHQINVKLTEEDVKVMEEINQDFFEGEATNSMLGKIILRKGMAVYKKLKSHL